jgi:hypothetical protein
MYRHLGWLQAMKNESHLKTELFEGDVGRAMDAFSTGN